MNDIMTSIKQVDGGCVIKSGDTASVFEFEILGDDGLKKDLSGIYPYLIGFLPIIYLSKNRLIFPHSKII